MVTEQAFYEIKQFSSWKPFSLTYITYPTTLSSDDDLTAFDILPQLLALLSLCPIFFICSLSTCTIVYKDVLAAYLLVGTLLMAFATSWLKKMIGQPRPPSSRGDEEDDDEFGMPSNHSSVALFGATFVILYLLVYRPRQRQQQQQRQRGGSSLGVQKMSSLAIMNGNSAKSSSSSQSLVGLAVIRWLYHHLHTTIPALFSVLIASGCAYSRVYLQYHTWNQVVAGSILGIGCGILWYALFRMDTVQEKLAQLDEMIQELELSERKNLIRDDDSDVKDDGERKRKKKK